MRLILTFLAVATLTACTPSVVYRPVQLPLPPEPDYPTVQAAEVECLADDTWARIVERDLARKQYAERLRQVILDNNAGQE